MKNIEVEVRSLISEERYKELIEFFKKECEIIKEDKHETYYFDCEEDLRIYRTNSNSIVLLKKGKVHDYFREEIEIKFKREDFEELEKLFSNLGFNVAVKWFRKRLEFKWQDINVCLDYTKGYGYIIELEKMSDENEKETILNELKDKLKTLNIKITSKEEFNKKYEYYIKNWKKLV
ncbi:CYTH domain-containing protein [Candidatus Woesearchaeota archaeon]|nr:CYTH domain-containing protein [Candidatus Woesearchaeota archaeon]